MEYIIIKQLRLSACCWLLSASYEAVTPLQAFLITTRPSESRRDVSAGRRLD